MDMSVVDDGIGFGTGLAFVQLLDGVREQALSSRRARRVSEDVVAQFRAAGVYRAFVARRFGGLEVSPVRFLEVVERIGHADASAGWVASFGVSALYLAALPVGTLEKIYASGPDVVFAGAIFPPQAAMVNDDGLIVSGRWPFASGCTGASLIGVGISIPDEVGGLPRTAVVPVGAVQIEETWNTLGLAGTGSHDVVLDNVRVARDWTFIRGGQASLEGAIYRYPSLALAAQVLAVVGLGCAQRALDEVMDMAQGRRSITGAPVMADRPYVQTVIGEIAAQLRAARSFFYTATQEAWDAAQTGEAVSENIANQVRLASTHSAQVSAEVARRCFELGGIVAVHADHILGRCMQDCAVVAQHAFMARGNYEVAGRVMLGRGGRPGYP